MLLFTLSDDSHQHTLKLNLLICSFLDCGNDFIGIYISQNSLTVYFKYVQIITCKRKANLNKDDKKNNLTRIIRYLSLLTRITTFTSNMSGKISFLILLRIIVKTVPTMFPKISGFFNLPFFDYCKINFLNVC